MARHKGDFNVEIKPRRDLAILAVQGPQAIAKVCAVKPELAAVIQALKPFQGQPVGDWFYARTGYTGEDGLEVMLPGDEAAAFFQQLQAAGVAPIGLGARDTLRLEAGMNLYGHDMDETVSPLEAGMASPSPGSRPSATSSAARRWKRRRRPACRASRSAWCWKGAACCAKA